MVNTRDYRKLEVDVLVIGGGAAATEAAINAHDSGAKVILTDKKSYGRSGDSGQHPAGNHTASYLAVEGDNADMHLRDTVECGKWMVNQKLAEALIEGINDDKLFLKIENYGSLETRTPEGNLALGYSTNKRRVTGGYRLFTHAYEVLKRGITILEHVMITALLTDSGVVVGATGIDLHTGEFYIFKAKSTVLATGGVGLAINGSLLNERTGDGHAAAYKAGARFWNMEFRAMPSGCIYPICLSRVPYMMIDLRTIRDRDGVEFLRDVPQNEYYSASYHSVRETERIIAEGKGSPHGGFYGQTVPINDIVRLMTRQGFDVNKFEHSWTPVYDFGGLVINEKAETSVPGLYACGEIATNSGAGYQPIRMFSHCIITGKWAGANAARRARRIQKSEINERQVDQEYDRVHGIFNNCPPDPLTVSEVRHKIQEVAVKGCFAFFGAHF